MKYEIGAKIKLFRERSGLTQKSFAEQIGVKNTTVSNWEQGVSRPDADTLAVICAVLDVSADELLGVNFSKVTLSRKERTVINAYRAQPEMQPAVDRILGIGEEVVKEDVPAPPPGQSTNLSYFPPPETDEPYDEIHKIGRIAAGIPIEAVQIVEDAYKVPRSWRASAALEVVGDSMEPDYPDGCLIAVRFQEEPQVGDLVVAQRFSEFGEVEATFKRLRYLNGSVVLEAINEAYDDMTWPRRETKFMGVIVGIVPDEDDE